MGERLIIRNFGPIKDVDIEIKRFTVFIGEQATGKSTIVKLLAVCRYFSNLVGKNGNDERAFEFGLYDWDLGTYWNNKTYIKYECQHYNLTVKAAIEENSIYNPDSNEREVESVPILASSLEKKSFAFKNLINELNKIKPQNIPFLAGEESNWVIPNSFYQNDVASLLDNPYYIYTERALQSIFSLGKNSIPNLSNPLFNYFDKTSFIQSSSYKNETNIEPLGIKYKNVNGTGFIKTESHDFISLAHSATGFQSAIPIVLLMNYYTSIKKRRKTFIIEEPEINLFPSTQNKLIQFIVDRTMNYGNTTLITTHSPYILTSLNNLIYASKVGKIAHQKANEIVPKRYWLNPDEICAYQLLKDGTSLNIIDAKEQIIEADRIDEISNSLNIDFDHLIELDLL